MCGKCLMIAKFWAALCFGAKPLPGYRKSVSGRGLLGRSTIKESKRFENSTFTLSTVTRGPSFEINYNADPAPQGPAARLLLFGPKPGGSKQSGPKQGGPNSEWAEIRVGRADLYNRPLVSPEQPFFTESCNETDVCWVSAHSDFGPPGFRPTRFFSEPTKKATGLLPASRRSRLL